MITVEQKQKSKIRKLVSQFAKPVDSKAWLQLANTLLPFLGVWVIMYYTSLVSIWLTLPFALLGGLLLVRLFIIFHDCGHGSFFKNKKLNDVWGNFLGMLTFTPYHHWTWEHSIHHSSSGNLDKRGVGDIHTMTIDEYLNASNWEKFKYRLGRNPIILFFVAPIILFLLIHRFPSHKAKLREQLSVWLTNLGIAAMAFGLIQLFGFWNWLIIQGVTVWVGGAAGIWMFYIQHQFEDAYWETDESWNYTLAALQGSSYYHLPKILQWFTGNIGFHHIHHLNSKIPNYNLEACHKADPIFEEVNIINLLSSLKSINLKYWDEKKRCLISHKELKLRIASA